MKAALSKPVAIALGFAALAVFGSLFIHPIALCFLAGPYCAYLLGRCQHPDLLDGICILGTTAISGLVLWLFLDLEIIAIYLLVAALTGFLCSFVTRPSRILAAIAGLAFAMAAGAVWVTYPVSLVIGVGLGGAMLCLQTHWLEQSRNARLDLEDLIALRTQRIRYLLRERDEVTTLAVHDLQSPIQAIAGMQKTLLHMLDDETPDKASIRQALEVAISTNADLSDRIGSLLSDSRDHLGGATDTTPLARILEGTIAAHKIELKTREISVQADTASQIHLRNDEDIKDILDVLLDNAIKYTPDDGKIAIIARHDAPENKVIIDICDNGPGVPEIKKENLFSAPKNSKAVNGRTGLGLYLASRRARRLGGILRYIPPNHAGTTFRIILPTVSPEA